MIVGEEGTEPVVPMGLLTAILGYEISWKLDGLQGHSPCGWQDRCDRQKRMPNGVAECGHEAH